MSAVPNSYMRFDWTLILMLNSGALHNRRIVNINYFEKVGYENLTWEIPSSLVVFLEVSVEGYT
jgi:hypothetical protein